jgi:outer membrane lipoprotein carrier protein
MQTQRDLRPAPLARRPECRVGSCERIAQGLALALMVTASSPRLRARSPSAGPCPSLEACLRRFEASYRGVRTLRASFTQEYSAWSRMRLQSGQVTLARGGRMRWEYNQPDQLFLADGREVLLYVPEDKQLTRTPLKNSPDVRVPLDLLLSHLNLRRAFSKIEFADSAGAADPRDCVLRAYPRPGFDQEYRDVLVELTPTFDIRRLVVTYPDESKMAFTFDHIVRNVAVSPELFRFTPPPGTEVIQQ